VPPRRVRSNAFDITRTDRDEATLTAPLSSLLPRVREVTEGEGHEVSTLDPGPAPGEVAVEAVVRPVRAAESRPSAPLLGRPRGVGGRPATATGRITATAARVPVELYEVVEPLVKGPGKPSWGQLIAWTCRTRQEDVVGGVLAQLRPPEGLVPRGQNKQARGTTQITARFTLPEHGTFTETLEVARAAAAEEDLPIPATATSVVIAALEVASR
jgi:hypothetical protein